jgi:hypothetical protein
MTIATTIPCAARQPAGIDRLAQRLGLALVAWGERSLVPSEEPAFDGVQQRLAEQILNDRALSVATRQVRYF